jgi:hypothetical protein
MQKTAARQVREIRFQAENLETIFEVLFKRTVSRDSVLGIATGYGLGDRGVRVRVLPGSRIFFSPLRPDRSLGPTKLLSNGYRGLFAQG